MTVISLVRERQCTAVAPIDGWSDRGDAVRRATEAIVMKASMGLLVCALALAASACTGGPQYALTPNEVDSGIYAADVPGPDALVLVLVDAAPNPAVQTTAPTTAVPPAIEGIPTPP